MKFNIILENGLYLPNCTVYSNYGIARNMTDFGNAIHKEKQVTIYNNNTSNEIIKDFEIYEYESSEEEN